MKGNFNRILHAARISYPPRRAPQEGKTEERAVDSVAASRRKRKRGSGGGVGSSKSHRLKGLLPLKIDYGSSPECGFAAQNTPRSAASKPPTVLMQDPFDGPFVPARKKAAKRTRVGARGGSTTDASEAAAAFGQGMLLLP